MRAWGSLAAVVVCFATAARAQLDSGISYQPSGAPGGQQWTATAGKTVGGGNGVIQVEGGWPGIGFTYLRGLDDRTDVGLHVGFNYGFEGTANSVIGLNVAVPYRRTLVDSGATAVAFRADPGVSVYGNNGALVGIGGPVGVVAGWRMDPRLTVDVGADMPILLSFSNPVGVLFGPQVGAGAEYLLDRNVAVTFRARVGPEFALASGGTGSQVGFTTLLGIAYNTR